MNKYRFVNVSAVIASMVWAACAPTDRTEPAGAQDGTGDIADSSHEPSHRCLSRVRAGDYIIRSQADLDELADYSMITGAVDIQVPGVTRLQGPPCLELIGGSLAIRADGELSRVTGFEGLRRIGGDLRVTGNLGPLEVKGFDKLRTVGGGVDFSNADFTIRGFAALDHIAGKLSGAYGSIVFQGMNQLSTVGSVAFAEYGSVIFDGLTDLETVLGTMRFFDAWGPISTAGLRDLSIIGNSLIFSFSPVSTGQGTTLAGFTDLDLIGGDLLLRSGADIQILDAFPELEAIGGGVSLYDLTQLTRVHGFPELGALGGDLSVMNAGTLREIDGMSQLQRVGGSLMIRNNESLASIAFAALGAIDQNLAIEGNPGLGELRLDELQTLGGALTIARNAGLPTCEAEILRQRLVEQGFTGPVEIAENAMDECY